MNVHWARLCLRSSVITQIVDSLSCFRCSKNQEVCCCSQGWKRTFPSSGVRGRLFDWSEVSRGRGQWGLVEVFCFPRCRERAAVGSFAEQLAEVVRTYEYHIMESKEKQSQWSKLVQRGGPLTAHSHLCEFVTKALCCKALWGLPAPQNVLACTNFVLTTSRTQTSSSVLATFIVEDRIWRRRYYAVPHRRHCKWSFQH